MYLPVGNCLRNLQFIIRRSRSFDQSTRSASVDCLLMCLALDICGITLTAGHSYLAAHFTYLCQPARGSRPHPVSSTGQALDPLTARRGSHPHPRIKYGAGSRSFPGEERESPSPPYLVRGRLHPLPEVEGVGAEGRRGLGRVLGDGSHPHPVSSTGQALNPLPEGEEVGAEGEG